MPKPAESLAALQAQFLALLYEDPATPADIVRSDALPAATRLDIYRNNLRGNFHKVLALEFPVIQQLCGAEYFEQLAREFQRAQPSRSGNVHHIGAGFAGWLASRMQGSGYEWFAGVATLEWAWQECYVAAEPSGRADFALLATLGEAEQEQLTFKLTPAARVLRSSWPVLSIWQAHQEDAAANGIALEDIDLTRGESVLVLRQAQGIRLHALGAGEAALLASLAEGISLGDAVELALAQDAALDLTAALQRAARLDLFSEIRVRR
jgi:hypothetical protein